VTSHLVSPGDFDKDGVASSQIAKDGFHPFDLMGLSLIVWAGQRQVSAFVRVNWRKEFNFHFV
jgi:hypothetical protein